jgi:hypothetical protein
VRLPELALALLLLVPAGPAAAAPPSRQEVERAVEAVRKHPDLGGTRSQKQLRLKPSKPEEQ